MDIDQSGLDTGKRKGIHKEVSSAAVDGILGDDMLPCLGKGLDGISNGSGTGCYSETGRTAFESSDTFFKNALGRVCESAVDIAGSGKGKAVLGVLAVREYIGSGGIDGDSSGIGCDVRLFLSGLLKTALAKTHRNTELYKTFR